MSKKTDSIAVIIGTPGAEWNDSGSPFAHVFALAEGEDMEAKARTCLHVFSTPDGGFEFGDGVVAMEGPFTIIHGQFEWPVLSAALTLPVKAYSGLSNTRPGQPSYQRLKNLVEDGYSGFASPNEEDGYATMLLEATTRWKEWNGEGTNMEQRFKEMCGASLWSKMNEEQRFNAKERFGKQCRSVGLRVGKDTHSELPLSELVSRLVFARAVFERLEVEQ